MRVARRRRHRERQDILRDRRSAANIGMRADAHELMHRAERSHHRPLFDRHVAAQGGAIHQHGVIADHAIVPDVRVRHDQQVAAHLGQSAALHRAAIDRHVLANLVVIADLEARRLAFVGDILRRHADGAKRKESRCRRRSSSGPRSPRATTRRQSSPSSTSAPITQYGPTLQEAGTFAPGSMIAVG